jgi:type II secretory pathway predicted ATPase ExeA
MKTEQKASIITALEAYIKEHGSTQDSISKNAGVNASYLINMRKGDFTIKSGDKVVQIADKYFKRIATLIGFETEKQYWPTRHTLQLKEIISLLNDAKTNAEIAVITGETGCGKSYSAEIFRSKFPGDVFIVKVGSSDNLGDLLDKIIDAFGLEIYKRSKSAKLRQIAAYMKQLSEKGNEPTLMLDESEYMKQPALCALKELYDVLNNWCALVLIGTRQLTDNIEKLKKRNKPGIPQLYRRIKFRIRELPAIDRSFHDFLDGLQPDLKRWLQRNCDNYGELHDVLVPAMREAERTNQELSEDFVKLVLGV